MFKMLFQQIIFEIFNFSFLVENHQNPMHIFTFTQHLFSDWPHLKCCQYLQVGSNWPDRAVSGDFYISVFFLVASVPETSTLLLSGLVICRPATHSHHPDILCLGSLPGFRSASHPRPWWFAHGWYGGQRHVADTSISWVILLQSGQLASGSGTKLSSWEHLPLHFL